MRVVKLALHAKPHQLENPVSDGGYGRCAGRELALTSRTSAQLVNPTYTVGATIFRRVSSDRQ